MKNVRKVIFYGRKILFTFEGFGCAVWATNFLMVANANLAALGLVADDLKNVTTDKTSFDTAVTNNAKQAEAKGAADNKNNSRKKFETTARL